MNALRQRIQTGAEEQRVARQHDLERLLRRYHNIKAELESQQSTERLRARNPLGSRLAQREVTRQYGADATPAGKSGGRPGSARPSSARPGSARQRAAAAR